MGLFSNFIKQLYKSQNLEVVIRPVRNPKTSLGSQVILPYSDYAPWKTDSLFSEIYNIMKTNTLVDIYRCWEIWESVGQVVKSIPGDVLEVGVWKGGTAGIIASRLAKADSSRTVYLADTFEGVVKAGQNDSVYVGGEHKDTSIPEVEDLLKNRLKVSNFQILKGIFPEDTGAQIENKTFALAHIDVDVYQSTKDIFNWVWPRMSKGGIVLFDDYGYTPCDGVAKCVNEMANDTDKLIFYNLNGHAVIVKV